jgi:hypothetical protein
LEYAIKAGFSESIQNLFKDFVARCSAQIITTKDTTTTDPSQNDGQGIVQKAWLQLIERVHQPLGFYRYKGNDITYVWKVYLGNV